MASLPRTTLALVVLTPAFAGLASCSQAEPSPSPTGDNTVVPGSVLSLIQSFRFAPGEPLRDAKREPGSLDVLWLGKDKPAARSTMLLDAEPRGRRVIEAFPGVKLTTTSTGFAITSPPLSRKLAAKQAEVTLPARLDAGFTVVDEGTKLGIGIKLVGATSSEGKIAETGLLVYENGFGKGRHVVHRPHAEGVEDYVVFEQHPEVEELRYEVQVPKKAGLRLVSNVLEVVDEDGAPRLRMAAPAVVQQNGVQVVPTVQVEGCAVDLDARPPWGRSVTAPGAEVCSVVVGWAAGAYPVVVDPAWTTTGAMTTARVSHTATLLPSGKVFVAGGYRSNKLLASTEAYDPATGTWSSGPDMKTARQIHTATLLPSGKVLVAGGVGNGNGPLASAEVYDPATGTWTDEGNMAKARHWHTATALASGEVLVVGGQGGGILASVELYDPATGTWVSGPDLTTARDGHTATLLPSGNVLVAGGEYEGAIDSSEVYDPTSDTWTSGPSLKMARYIHTATLLPSGKVLVAGGFNTSSKTLASVEMYDPATGKWASGGSMKTARHFHTATLLPSGNVLVAGGANSGFLASAEVYDPATDTWTDEGNMAVARTDHTATLLPSGNVLVAGGSSGTILASAEVWGPNMLGGTCAQDEDCDSGKCVDGVCCDTACDGVCEACSQAKTGKVDGTCAPVTADTDPDNECSTLGDGLCKTSGMCDGNGACATKAGTECAAATCSGTATQKNSSTCDSAGGCVPPVPATTDCAPYACKGTACLTACTDATDCAAGTVCNAVTKTCGPATSTCVDATHVKGTSGQVEMCPAGYTCSSATGTCNTKCSTNAECDTASGYKCEDSECKEDAGAAGAAGGGGAAGAGGSTTTGAGTGGASTAGTGGGGGSTTAGAGTGGASTAGTGGGGGSTIAGNAPAEGSEDDGGCGCEVPRSSRSTMWPGLAVAGLALADLRRRSRR